MTKNSDPMQGFLEQLLRDWESGGVKTAAPPPPPAKAPSASVVRALPELSEAVALSADESPAPAPVVVEESPKPTPSWKPAPKPSEAVALSAEEQPAPVAVVAESPKPTLSWKPAPAPPPPSTKPAFQWKPPAPAPPELIAPDPPVPLEVAAEQRVAEPPKPTFQWRRAPSPLPPPQASEEPPVAQSKPAAEAPAPKPLIDFAAALSALKAARPPVAKAPAPPPEPVEIEVVPPEPLYEQTGKGNDETVEEDVPLWIDATPEPEAIVEPEIEITPEPEIVAEEVLPEPEPEAAIAVVEPEPEVIVEPEPVVEPEPEVIAEPEMPVAEALVEAAPEVVAEPEPESEWEEIATPLPPPGRPAGPELASVVAELETSLPSGTMDLAEAESRRVELRRHLVFAINNETFAVNLDNLVEIDNMPTWTGIPGLPQTVRGLINLRGEIVSLLELRAILGLPHPEVPKKGKIFVATTADRQSTSAFAVDEIEGILGFDVARMTPLPDLTSAKGVTATVEESGRLVRILDIGSVLTGIEKTFSLDQVWM